MDVIGPSCTLPSENSPGCGGATNRTGNKIAGAATATALAAAACTACCILPFTFPAAVLAFAGGSIAILDHAHGWVTKLAIAVVACAWFWIAWQRKRTGRRRIGRTTIVLMVLATVLTTGAASWPPLEPVAFHALGIVKKKAVRANE